MDIGNALEFLRSNHWSVLIARKSNGDPQPSPVNHGVDAQGRVVISSREPAYKVRNIRRDPRVSLCAFTNRFYGEWVNIDGTAEIISLPEAMEPLVDLFRQIQGEHPDWDDYRAAMVRDKRLIIAITPTSAGPDRAG
ncbi:MAG TPA: PPOX class F420-dependent oxidoreductase [Acidimicrobiales bacterium]|nr:PPOX class F420-dependent oxidoreductase [Acidimicrobiales bacterium]